MEDISEERPGLLKKFPRFTKVLKAVDSLKRFKKKYAQAIHEEYGVSSVEDAYLHLWRWYNKGWALTWKEADKVYHDYIEVNFNDYSVSKKRIWNSM